MHDADRLVARTRRLFRLPKSAVAAKLVASRIPGYCRIDAVPEDARDFSGLVVKVPFEWSEPAQARHVARATVRYLAARWAFDPCDEALIARAMLALFGVRSLALLKARQAGGDAGRGSASQAG